jgi:putative drug exporter of the RND superfamily
VARGALLGRANWWLPGRLDRLLPHLDGGHGSPETVTQRDQVTVS